MPPCTANAKKLYRISTFGRSFDPLYTAHLSTRAWTLQERLLSPRTIHFARDQMYWECRYNLIVEDGALFAPSFFSTDLLLDSQKIEFEEHGMQGLGKSLVEGDWPDTGRPCGRWRGGWLAHIADFCQRNLTNEQDKLSALSGIAKFIAQKTGDQYLAGLWKNHLLEDLYWRTSGKGEDTVQAKYGFEPSIEGLKLCDIAKPKKYRAPTWSWASLDSHISFDALSFKHIVAEVIECRTIPAGVDTYGRVSSGVLKVKAPFFQVSPLSAAYIPWRKPGTPVQIRLPVLNDAASISVDDERFIPQPHSQISVGTANFDFAPTFPCFALFLDAANCLLLTLSKDQEYERIGIAQFCRPSLTRIKDRKVPEPRTLKREEINASLWDRITHMNLGVAGPRGTWGPITEEYEKRVVTIV